MGPFAHADGNRTGASFRGLPDLALDSTAVVSILAAAPDGIVVVDEDGRIVLVNDELTAMFGYQASELLGRSIEVLVPDAQRGHHRLLRKGYASLPRVRAMGGHGTLHGCRADGELMPVEISLSPVEHADQRLVVAVVRDVSDRLGAEERARQGEEALRLVAERERIARDLHDTVIQELFATGMSLQAVSDRIDDPVARDRLVEAVTSLDDTIRRIRTVIFGLSNHRSPAGSLRREILKVVSDETRALGFEPQLTIHGPIEQIPRDIAAHVVGVVREAISNIARHAKADAVEVTIAACDDRLDVVVSDDGRGLPDHFVPGRGLANLRQRASELGGTVSVEPGPAGGTRVELTVPVPD